MTKRDLLAPVRKLLRNPERWTKGWLAKDGSGENTEPRHPTAVCYCIRGALRKFNLDNTEVEDELRRRACVNTGHILLVPWNDAPERTHADILKLLEKPFYGDSK